MCSHIYLGGVRNATPKASFLLIVGLVILMPNLHQFLLSSSITQNRKIFHFNRVLFLIPLHILLFCLFFSLFRLVDNPICHEAGESQSYCSDVPDNISYTAPPVSCIPVACKSDQNLSPNCKCAYPFIGILSFRTPSFPDWQNYVHFEKNLMDDFKANDLPVDSVSMKNLTLNQYQDLDLSLQVFPSREDHFNSTEISSITSLLSNLTNYPFYFIPSPYRHYGNYFGLSIFQFVQNIHH